MFKFSKLKRALAFSIFGLVAIVTRASSQPKSSQGIIAFSSNRDWHPELNLGDGVPPENNEIYALSPDDKKSVRLTNDPESDATPSLSADGKRLFFSSWRSGKVELYSMKLGAKLHPPVKGQLQRIVTGDEFASVPVPSRDGRYLAYTSENGGESWLKIISLNGGLKKKVTRLDGSSTFVAFVPDNRRIMFTVGHANSHGRDENDICIVNLDGTGRKVIGRGFNLSCNPQGTRVVFATFGPLRSMNLDGSDLRQFGSQGSSSGDPSYSPDGGHIVFAGEPQARSARGLFAREALNVSEGTAIYIMKADGTEVQRLTYGRGDNTQPTWSKRPGVPYTPPPSPRPTPNPQVRPLTQLPRSDAFQSQSAFGSRVLNTGELVYAFNDLKTAPYSSFVGVRSSKGAQVNRVVGPRLQGLDGDFVFDAQLVPGTTDVLLKLGDPAVRPDNPFNSYHLWNWNRHTNALTLAAPRALFFRQVAPSPGGRHIAYIAGGNALGQTPEENSGLGEPLRLLVYDMQSKQETLISINSGVRGGFAWLDANTLLYTTVSTPTGTSDNRKAIAQPDIYAFDLKTDKSTLLIRAARHPQPSPDGKHIAFWGLRPDEEPTRLPDEWWQQTGYDELNVVARDGGGRTSFGRRPGLYPSLAWTPDGERLLLVDAGKPSEEGQSKSKQVSRVEERNLMNGRVREVARLEAQDAQDVVRAWFQHQFRVLGVSSDGNTLFVSAEEVTKEGNTIARVQAIVLLTGKVVPIVQLRNATGFDWQMEAIHRRR